MSQNIDPRWIASVEAQAIVRSEINRLARRLGIKRNSIDDLQQEVNAQILTVAHQYEGHRGAPGAFIRMVARSTIQMHMRECRAEKRKALYRNLSFDEEVFQGDDSLLLGQLLSPADAARRLGFDTGESDVTLRMDLAEVVATMPEDDRRICEVLMNTGTVSEAARVLGISRQQIYRHLPSIKCRLRLCGLGPEVN